MGDGTLTGEKRYQIPIRIKGRGAVIGYCERAPCGSGITLATFPKAGNSTREDEGDQLTLDRIAIRLTYDFPGRCYWADDYDCLRSDAVVPY